MFFLGAKRGCFHSLFFPMAPYWPRTSSRVTMEKEFSPEKDNNHNTKILHAACWNLISILFKNAFSKWYRGDYDTSYLIKEYTIKFSKFSRFSKWSPGSFSMEKRHSNRIPKIVPSGKFVGAEFTSPGVFIGCHLIQMIFLLVQEKDVTMDSSVDRGGRGRVFA